MCERKRAREKREAEHEKRAIHLAIFKILKERGKGEKRGFQGRSRFPFVF